MQSVRDHVSSSHGKQNQSLRYRIPNAHPSGMGQSSPSHRIQDGRAGQCCSMGRGKRLRHGRILSQRIRNLLRHPEKDGKIK